MSKLTLTRFGIVGCGRITRRLVADFQAVPDVLVTAIASRSPERAQQHADRYQIRHAVTGYQNLLERDDVDAIYIALPPSMHASMTLAAAAAGKHVLCEKPLGTTAAQVRDMLAACQAAGVRCMDATAWLHHPRTESIQQLLDIGALGPLRHVSSAVSFPNAMDIQEHRMQPELGGGCLLDLGWYAAGIARYAFQQMPTQVRAQGIFKNGVPVRVTAMMRFPNDRSATLSCGFDTTTRRWFEIAGVDASVVCDDFTRPMENSSARYWVHLASGKVSTHSFLESQEQAMIRTFIGQDDLQPYQQQSLETQIMLDALQQSLNEDRDVFLEPSP